MEYTRITLNVAVSAENGLEGFTITDQPFDSKRWLEILWMVYRFNKRLVFLADNARW
jgi:hypothetical protein